MNYELKMYLGKESVGVVGRTCGMNFNAMHRLAVVEMEEQGIMFFVDTDTTTQLGQKDGMWEANIFMGASASFEQECRWKGKPKMFWQAMAELDSAIKKYLRAKDESKSVDISGLLCGVMAGMGMNRIL